MHVGLYTVLRPSNAALDWGISQGIPQSSGVIDANGRVRPVSHWPEKFDRVVPAAFLVKVSFVQNINLLTCQLPTYINSSCLLANLMLMKDMFFCGLSQQTSVSENAIVKGLK